MSGFETHARTVSLLTFGSRISGLLREAILSRVFGAGPVMDAFSFAFMVPNLFRRLFGEGALSSAFLPVYARTEQSDPARAALLARLVIGRTAALLAALTLAGEVILALLPVADESQRLGHWLLMLMLPYMPLVCVVALLGAVLQSHHRFGVTAAAPIILNGAVAATALLPWALGGSDALPPRIAICIVAGSVLLAGIAQVAWSMWALRGTMHTGAGERAGAREDFRRVMRTMAPMALGLGVLQLSTFLDGLIASYPTLVGPTIMGQQFPLEQGSMARLTFAQRLYEFPLGVFGIAVATALFPALSRLAHDGPAFRETLERGLRTSFFIAFPAGVGLLVLARPCVAAVFQGGDFDATDSAGVAGVLAAYACAIWAYSCNQLLTRAFYARGETMTPVRISMAVVAINVVVALALIWTPLRVAGIACATAIGAAIQCAWLCRALGRAIGPLGTRELRRSVAQTLVIGAACAAVSGGARWLCESRVWPELGWDAQGWFAAVATLAVAIPLGAGAVFLSARLMRMPELNWALGRSTPPGSARA